MADNGPEITGQESYVPEYMHKYRIIPTRPLIVVPGILGTKLINKKTAETLWPNFNSIYGQMNPAPSLRWLFTRFPNDDIDCWPESDPDGRVNEADPQENKLFPLAYDGLCRWLDRVGYTAGIDYWVFPYDWRRSNKDSGAKLAEYIARKIGVFNDTHQGAAASDCDVICHSMGGLVTRAAIRLSRAPVRRTVYIACPHYGSPKAYFVLQPGVPWSLIDGFINKVIENYVWRNYFQQYGDSLTVEEQLRKMFVVFPSVYECLPDQYYFGRVKSTKGVVSGYPVSVSKYGDLETTMQTYTNPPNAIVQPARDKLQLHNVGKVNEGMAFKLSLTDQLPGKHLSIFSPVMPTDDRVSFDQVSEKFGSPESSTPCNGDGTVPAISARIPDAAYSLSGTHSALPNEWRTHREIYSWWGDNT